MSLSAHRRLVLAAAAALAAILVLVALRVARRAPPSDVQPPVAAPSASVAPQASASPALTAAPEAGPAELRLVAPLVAGSRFAGFTIREIQGVHRGRVRVVCVKEKAVVRLDITLADTSGPDGGRAITPPATAGRYDVFYSLRGAEPEDGELLATRLARILNKNADAPTPEGMTVFTPDRDPGATL